MKIDQSGCRKTTISSITTATTTNSSPPAQIDDAGSQMVPPVNLLYPLHVQYNQGYQHQYLSDSYHNLASPTYLKQNLEMSNIMEMHDCPLNQWFCWNMLQHLHLDYLQVQAWSETNLVLVLVLVSLVVLDMQGVQQVYWGYHLWSCIICLCWRTTGGGGGSCNGANCGLPAATLVYLQGNL